MQQYRYDRITVPRTFLFVVGRGLAILAVLAATAGCRRGDGAPPVAAVMVTPARARVTVGSPLTMTYRFDVAPGATINGDYTVFVHVTDADGQVVWNDDHQPGIPTSQWKPGQVVEYTRTSFVPAVPHPGRVSVDVGLYRGTDRLPLRGPAAGGPAVAAREYRVATLDLAPATENIFLIYKSGWHPDEFAQSDPTTSWKWTQRSAVLSFPNPHADAMFYLQYDARPDLVGGAPQQVTVLVAGHSVASFAADSREIALRRIPIAAADFGDGDMSELQIDVDRAFVPAEVPGAGKDTRELGIRVYHAFLERR